MFKNKQAAMKFYYFCCIASIGLTLLNVYWFMHKSNPISRQDIFDLGDYIFVSILMIIGLFYGRYYMKKKSTDATGDKM